MKSCYGKASQAKPAAGEQTPNLVRSSTEPLHKNDRYKDSSHSESERLTSSVRDDVKDCPHSSSRTSWVFLLLSVYRESFLASSVFTLTNPYSPPVSPTGGFLLYFANISINQKSFCIVVESAAIAWLYFGETNAMGATGKQNKVRLFQ